MFVVVPSIIPPERFFVDENMLSVGKALAMVRPDIVYPGHPGCATIPRGTLDEDWLETVGRAGWAVLMRDKKVRQRPGERQKLRQHHVRAFCLTSAGNQTSWEMLEMIVRHWAKIERAAAQPGPFIHSLTIGGVSAQPLPL